MIVWSWDVNLTEMSDFIIMSTKFYKKSDKFLYEKSIKDKGFLCQLM